MLKGGKMSDSDMVTTYSEQLFVGINELAEIINESKFTIYSWVQRGKIPSLKRGKRLKFNLREIENWDATRNHRAAE
jgi:excisionase family DNA binding protein